MTEKDILAQSSKDIRQAASLLTDILDLAGIRCSVRYHGTAKTTHMVVVRSEANTGLHADLHMNGSITVWCHDVSQSYPDLIDAAVAFKSLLTGGE